MVYTGLDGNTYTSLQKLADAHGINRATLASRLKAGVPLEEALKSGNRVKRSCVDPNNKYFESLEDMCRHWGIPKGVYKNRMRYGWSMIDALTIPPGEKGRIASENLAKIKEIKDKKMEAMAVEYKGKRYRSLNNLSYALGISPSTMSKWVKQGKSIDEIVDMHKQLVDIKTDHLGVKFKSVKEMCESWNIPQEVYFSRLRIGMSKKEALTTPIRKKARRAEVEYNGKKYESIRKLAGDIGIPYNTLTYKIKAGYSLNEAIESIVSAQMYRCYDTIGGEYISLQNMAETWKVKYPTFKDRLKSGVDIIVALVSEDITTLKFIGLDGKARYQLGNHRDKLYTARQIVEKYRPDLLDSYDKHNPTGKYEPYMQDKEE